MNEAQLQTLIDIAGAQAFPLLCLADHLCNKGLLDRDELIVHIQNSIAAQERPAAFDAAGRALIAGLLVTHPDLPA